MIFIFGASGSGKSEFAENITLDMGENRTYIATMKIYGEEEIERIKKHRLERADKNFKTIECFERILNLSSDKNEIILFECMANYLANNMFLEDGNIRLDEKLIDNLYCDLIFLDKHCKKLIVVGNDVFDNKNLYSKEVQKYIENLYLLQSRLMEYSEQVIEMVYGIPIYLKG